MPTARDNVVLMRYVYLFAFLSLAACQSRDCVPHSEACLANVPRTCSSTGHGYAAGGAPRVPCSDVIAGGVCVVIAGRVTCVSPDAGVDVAEVDDAALHVADVEPEATGAASE